jgi:hypothetical protein
MSDRVTGRSEPAARFVLAVRDVGVLLLVLGGLGVLTFLLGQVPTCTRPDPRPHEVANVTASEQVLGATLLLPAYFPDDFAWPPTYRAGREPTPWVAMEVRRRDGQGDLAIVQSVQGEPRAPAAPGRLVRDEALRFDADQARLRVFDAPGGPYCEIRWRRGERRLLLYGHVDPETARRMAHSMRSRLVTEAR